MNRKTKILSLLAVCATSISTAVIWVIIRLGRHAVAAGKVAATSGVLLTATAPMFMADKAHMGTFVPFKYEKAHQDVVKQLKELMIKGNVAQAMQVFEKARENSAKDTKGEVVSLVNAWLSATLTEKTSAETRNAAIDFITKEYPFENISKGNDIEAYGSLATAFWMCRPPQEALEYSMKILTSATNVPIEQREYISKTITGMSMCVAHISKSDEKLLKARKMFAIACMKTFPPEQLSASKDSMTLYNSIVTALFSVGEKETGLDYLKTLLKKSDDLGKNQEFCDEVLKCIMAMEKLDMETGEQVLCLAAPHASPPSLSNGWSLQVKHVPGEKQHSYGQELLNHYGSIAAGVVPAMLSTHAKSVPLEDIISEQCGLMSYEIEAGIKSQSLDHLVKELKDRNANNEIEEIAHFIWKTFPTEPAGAQALGLWIQNQDSIAGQAQVIPVCQELMESYPNQLIAKTVRLALAEKDISDGRVVEALLMVNEDNGEFDKQTALTVSVFRDLLSKYFEAAAGNGMQIDKKNVKMKLAEQLDRADEKGLASLFYWEVSQEGGLNMGDPRTDMPLDPPDTSAGIDEKLKQSQTQFWRSLALAAVGQDVDAITLMENLLETDPGYKDTCLAQAFLVKQYYKKGDTSKAWNYVWKLPKEMRDTKVLGDIYTKLAATVPVEQQKIQNKQKLEQLKNTLLNNPKAPGADAVAMEIAELLVSDRQYAEAALNFEAIPKQYPESSYCPEALYRAITIYKTKVSNLDRGKELSDILKTQYPKSRYAQLLKD